jgi:glycosyltransferase involved in cell wall biosynthesis
VNEPGDPPGLRVVLDVRPLQDTSRSPVTARYLDGLLSAFDAAPLPGESFAFLLQSDLEDPTQQFVALDVVGRRLLPPTRLLRSAAMTIDPFLLRGASVGAAWRAERRGAAGAVYHAVAGTSPLFARIPIVVTLLDLAPWELPQVFQRGPAVRFGQRLRTQLLRDAAAIIVGTEAVATAARRLLRLHHDRLRVVPFAADPAFSPPVEGAADPDSDAERERLGLAGRYLVYSGRYDARQDLGTLLRAIGLLAAKPRPRTLPGDAPWPPRILLVGASPADRAALARASLRAGVSDSLAYAPGLPPARLAALARSARAAILPVLSDAAGLSGIDAIAAGVPVVASAVGALPEIVGRAGILVEPRDPARLAEALRTVWVDDRMHQRLRDAARDRGANRRTWADVALETRRIYAEVGVVGSAPGVVESTPPVD